MVERVILVDGNDSAVGSEDKVRCHLPDGMLHRAFTALLFDAGGRLVLARRSPDKMLWPGCWDGTFASHPREGETYVSSAERRMPEEMGGVECAMDYLFKFEYHVPYKDIGSENEVCGTLIGVVDTETEFDPVRGEISEVRRISAGELAREVSHRPRDYCPWMLVALHLLDRSVPEMLERHKGVLEPWIRPETLERMGKAAAEAHLPESAWRQVRDG